MKFLYKIASSLRKIYWYIFSPETCGVRCLVECDDKYLLIKHSYGSALWNIPGGGIKSKEDKVSTVKREVFEELGIVLDTIKYIGEYVSTLEYHKDTVYCFHAIADIQVPHLNAEIQEVRWFDKNNLPEDLSSSIKRCLTFLEPLKA